MTSPEPESIVLCPKGHTMGLSRITDVLDSRRGLPRVGKGEHVGVHHEITLAGKELDGIVQVPALRGFAFPCPTCMLIYWDNGQGQVSPLSTLQFVATYLAMSSEAAANVMTVAQMQRETACLHNSAEAIVTEVTKRGLRGGNVS